MSKDKNGEEWILLREGEKQYFLPTSTVFKEGLPVKMYTGNSNFWERYCYCRFIAEILSLRLGTYHCPSSSFPAASCIFSG